MGSERGKIGEEIKKEQKSKYIFLNFIYLWLYWIFVPAHGLFLVMASGGFSRVSVHRLLIVVLSLVSEYGLWGTWASVVVVLRLKCPQGR